MIACKENCSDVSKYFQGTFIMVPEVAEDRWFHLRNVGSGGMILVDSVTNEEGLVSFEDGGSYKIQNPLFNRNSWFNVGNGCKPCFVERKPDRQWKKGLAEGNTQIYTFNSAGNLTKVPFSVAILNGYLQQLKEFDSQNGGAFNRLWAYAGSKGWIYYKDVCVGKTSKDLRRVYLAKEFSHLSLPEQLKKVAYV